MCVLYLYQVGTKNPTREIDNPDADQVKAAIEELGWKTMIILQTSEGYLFILGSKERRLHVQFAPIPALGGPYYLIDNDALSNPNQDQIRFFWNNGEMQEQAFQQTASFEKAIETAVAFLNRKPLLETSRWGEY